VYVGFLGVLRDEGVVIGQDLSVVSAAATFNVSELGQPLDELSVPVAQVGAMAADLLFAQLGGQKPPTAPVLIDPVYVDRGSVRRRGN
jgi:DNA-binding LacI/PurR family transcriptional regulator